MRSGARRRREARRDVTVRRRGRYFGLGWAQLSRSWNSGWSTEAEPERRKWGSAARRLTETPADFAGFFFINGLHIGCEAHGFLQLGRYFCYIILIFKFG